MNSSRFLSKSNVHILPANPSPLDRCRHYWSQITAFFEDRAASFKHVEDTPLALYMRNLRQALCDDLQSRDGAAESTIQKLPLNSISVSQSAVASRSASLFTTSLLRTSSSPARVQQRPSQPKSSLDIFQHERIADFLAEKAIKNVLLFTDGSNREGCCCWC